MADSVDFAVIGRGLIGTACARHLAEAGHSVALIGPDEPVDRARHHGPFASFHDAARITRHLASDADWARLAKRSIDRYRDLEERSGLTFYHPCGGLMVGLSDGPGRAYAEAFTQVAETENVACAHLNGSEVSARFPMLALPNGARAALDPVGGWIDPRVFRKAEENLAEAAGAQVVRDAAVALHGGSVTLQSGERVEAAQIVVATGAYGGMGALLREKPDLRVYARTIAFVAVSEDEAKELASMPSVIFWPEDQNYDHYVLPPVRYPDGQYWIKIGGEAESPRLAHEAEMTAWFQSPGDTVAGQVLLDALGRLMPDLRMDHTATAPCAVSFTATDKPYIERVDETVTLLTGGNGAGAKCADELGRLGAMVALGQSLEGEGYACDFGAVYESANGTSQLAELGSLG